MPVRARKILIVGPSWVGDMVMAQSLFKVLKQAHPRAALQVLAPPWSVQILERMPEVEAALCMPVGHGELNLRARWALGRRLRQSQFDRAIVLPNSLKAALVPWFANIPTRTGYVGEQRWGLLNDIRRLNRAAMPMNVQRFVALGLPKSAPAAALQADAIPQPKLAVKRASANATAARFNLADAAEKKAVALCPGAEYGPAKQWPAEHFAAVAKRQLQQGRQVWLLGSQNDQAIAARIAELCRHRCADLTGRTTLGEAIDLLSLAQYAVTNDSGLLHVAAASGCHVIALYGSSSATFTPPLTARGRRDCLALPLHCSPCFQRTCRFGHVNCLNKLSPERVLARMK